MRGGAAFHVRKQWELTENMFTLVDMPQDLWITLDKPFEVSAFNYTNTIEN